MRRLTGLGYHNNRCRDVRSAGETARQNGESSGGRREQPCTFESLLPLAISEAYFSCIPSKSVELSLQTGSLNSPAALLR